MVAPVSVQTADPVATVLVTPQGPPSLSPDYLVIYEGDAGDVISVSFLAPDDNGDLVPYAPTTVHYRIDCLTTQQQVRDWTEITPAAETVTITLEATDNQLLGSAGSDEKRQVVVAADRETASQKSNYVTYWVKRIPTYE